MNVLFFLTPKVNVQYLYDDSTIRQALEKMEYHRYTSIPIISRSGEYVGTLTEGDLLWAIKNNFKLNIKDAENYPISIIPHKKDYLPIHINENIEDLISKSIDQNFIPVLDDKDAFIGIVTRKSIIQYCYSKVKF